MRVLVTGAGGFIGRHLCKKLRARGIEAIAIGRSSSAAQNYVDRLVTVGSIPDSGQLKGILQHYRPDAVCHLAGSPSARTLEQLYEVNLFFAVALLEACRALANPPRIVIAGSAAEYGRPVATGRLMHENDAAHPLNAYGETKLAQTVHALRQCDLPVVVARIFNPIGVGLPASRAVGRFVEEVRALAAQGSGVVTTGPLDGTRDLIEVGTLSDAMIGLLTGSVPTGEIYNLCSGVGVRMREITETLQALVSYPVSFQAQQGDGGVDWAVGDPGKVARHGITMQAPDLRDVLSRMLDEPADHREIT